LTKSGLDPIADQVVVFNKEHAHARKIPFGRVWRYVLRVIRCGLRDAQRYDGV
jgi:hypothetical protein